MAEARRCELAGDFAGATARWERIAGTPATAPESRAAAEFDIERLRRIRRDFRRTREEVWRAVAEGVRDATPEEFARWVGEGRFDRRIIDGEERFFVSSLSNLFFRHPELETRRVRSTRSRATQEAHWETVRAILAAARGGHGPWVEQKRFRVRMTVTMAAGTGTPGEPARCWLPVPRRYPHQTGIEILGSTPRGARLAPETSPIRSAYLEQPLAADGGARFEIEYAFVARGIRHDLDPDRSAPASRSEEVAPFLREAPHVRFTPAMRRLAAEAGAGETNAVRLARRFYEHVSRVTRYSYAPEYSTIPDLAEACRAEGRGDCGQAAFLFMTLCRLSGIPARWQSGWSIFPGDETIHDWCEIHLEPWGWVPVDPYMGMYATQYATALEGPQRAELRDFYFGGLDPFRIAVNADHQQELRPEKGSWRSDPVDFQRGELEVGGRNVYFDRFDYELKWEEIVAGSTP